MSSGWVMSAKVRLASSDGLYPVSSQNAALSRQAEVVADQRHRDRTVHEHAGSARAPPSARPRGARARSRRGSLPPPLGRRPSRARTARSRRGTRCRPRAARAAPPDPARRSRSQGRENSSSTPHELAARQPEQVLHPRVHRADPVLPVHEQHRVRRELEQGFVLAACVCRPGSLNCVDALPHRAARSDLPATGAVLRLPLQRHAGQGVRRWLLPLIGFFLLPWTTLAYTVMWDIGHAT